MSGILILILCNSHKSLIFLILVSHQLISKMQMNQNLVALFGFSKETLDRQ